MSVFNKINSGFKLGVTEPIVSGLEDWLYVYNEADFIIQYDPTNPMIVTGFIPVGGGKFYKFTGTNNSFGSSSKSVPTAVGPRFIEELDWNIAGNSTAVKQMAMGAGYGRVRAIAVNNFKSGDSAIELYGANNGLIADFERTSSDESIEGGWKMKLHAPDKLREPYPPRAVLISPLAAGVAGTPPLVNTATLATAAPTGVTISGSTTGGTIPAQTSYYKVVSVDAFGTTLGSTEVSTVNTGTTSSNTISWNPAQGATSYRVYRGTSAGAESVYYTTNATSYVDTNAASTSGTVPVTNTATKATAIPASVAASGATTGGELPSGAVYYVVTAVDGLGETVASSEVTVTNTGSTSANTISWNAAQGAVTYKVYKGTTSGAENLFFQTSGVSFVDTGVVIPPSYQSTLAAIEALSV